MQLDFGEIVCVTCNNQKPAFSGRYRLWKMASQCGIASTTWPFSTKVEWLPTKFKMLDSMVQAPIPSAMLFVSKVANEFFMLFWKILFLGHDLQGLVILGMHFNVLFAIQV